MKTAIRYGLSLAWGCGAVLVLGLMASIAQADEPGGIRDITWELGPNLPEFRKAGCATVMGGKVISVFGMRHPWGEMDTMYIYDPETRIWSAGPTGPLGQAYVLGTECGTAFYSIGGRSQSIGGIHGRCYRLESRGGMYTWTRMPDLNEARSWSPSVSVGSCLYVFGGARSSRGPMLTSVERLDTAKPGSAWEKVSEVPGPSRGWTAAAAVQGRIYLIGGRHFHDVQPGQSPKSDYFRDAWRFDPASRTWDRVAPLPCRLSGIDSCVYQDRYIILVGGAAQSDDFTDEMKRLATQDKYHASYYCPFVFVYDTRTDRWTRMPSLLPMPTHGIRVAIDGRRLYAIGGENVEPASSNTTPWLRIGLIDPAN